MLAAQAPAARSDDASEPERKSLSRTQLFQRGVRREECFLGRVPRQVRITQPGQGIAVRHVLVALHDDTERGPADHQWRGRGSRAVDQRFKRLRSLCLADTHCNVRVKLAAKGAFDFPGVRTSPPWPPSPPEE